MSSHENLDNAQLSYVLKLAQHKLRLQMDEALRPLGLTTPQLSVLSQLQKQPGISNAALARDAFVTAQTMHAIVSKLEKDGLLLRTADPHHGRILKAKLTDQGEAVLKQAYVMVEDAEQQMVGSLTLEQQQHLKSLLMMCVHNLD